MTARVCGLAKTILVAARKKHLEKGTDWQVVDSVVCYTPPGLKKILVSLGLDGEALDWAAGAGGGENPPAVTEPREQGTAGAGEACVEDKIIDFATEPDAEPADLSLVADAFLKVSQAHAAEKSAERRPDAAAVVAAGIALQQAALASRELQTLTITRLSRNPMLVHARGQDGGAEVTVRVKTNINFLPAMTLTARPPAAGAAPVWFHVGNCPRWRGRY
jgi:hypothetical protein